MLRPLLQLMAPPRQEFGLGSSTAFLREDSSWFTHVSKGAMAQLKALGNDPGIEGTLT